MTKNYYSVTAKFGHVGRNKYIVKTIPVRAIDGKEAAEIARWTGRVKHHAKDAIIDVKRISKEEYLSLKETNNNDPYFGCKNIQQQDCLCSNIFEESISIDDDNDFEHLREKRKERVKYKMLKRQQYRRESASMLRCYSVMFS